jgi:DNA-binding transcriptional LysR family regulator
LRPENSQYLLPGLKKIDGWWGIEIGLILCYNIGENMNTNATNLNFYRVFLAVYEAGSFAQASERLFTPPPTINYQIKELEKQLGAKLFVPHPRGVTPTDKATELYNTVKPAFASIMQGEADIQEFNEGSVGVIKIACTTNFSTYYLARFIGLFKQKYKSIEFDIVKASGAEVVKLIQNRNVDFVLSTLPFDKEEQLSTIVLETLASTFYTTKGFAEAHNIQDTITIEEFEKLPFIAIKEHEEYNKPAISVQSFGAAYTLVRQGLGVSWCIKEFLRINHANEYFEFKVEGITLRDYVLKCAFNKKSLGKAATVFIETLMFAHKNVAPSR